MYVVRKILHTFLCAFSALPTSAEVFCLLLMRFYFLLPFIYLYSSIAVYCIKINKNSSLFNFIRDGVHDSAARRERNKF